MRKVYLNHGDEYRIKIKQFQYSIIEMISMNLFWSRIFFIFIFIIIEIFNQSTYSFFSNIARWALTIWMYSFQMELNENSFEKMCMSNWIDWLEITRISSNFLIIGRSKLSIIRIWKIWTNRYNKHFKWRSFISNRIV